MDLVIEPAPESLREFVQRVEALGLYASAEAASEADQVRGMFNVVDSETGPHSVEAGVGPPRRPRPAAGGRTRGLDGAED